jgi:hypothetical protein
MGPMAMLPSAVEAEPRSGLMTAALVVWMRWISALSFPGLASWSRARSVVMRCQPPARVLASAASTFITGTALPGDGGYASEV